MKLYVDFLDKSLVIRSDDRHILKNEFIYKHGTACFGDIFTKAYEETGDNEDLLIRRYPHINDVETFAIGVEKICNYFSLPNKGVLRLVYVKENDGYAVVKGFDAAISRIGYQSQNKPYK